MNAWVSNIKGLFKYRELLFRLSWKEIRVRYKEPILGFLWALLVPLFMSLILMFVFTRLIKVPIKEYPFFIFLVTGVFPWNLFSSVVSTSVMSVLEGGDLIKKVYFPREIIPLSIVMANAINFLFTLIVVIMFVVFFGIRLTPFIFLLPVAFILQVFFISGMSFLIAGSQVVYRDTKFIVEILLPLWFYMSPIFYPMELVLNISRQAFLLYSLNPFVGLISLYWVSLLGDVYLKSLPGEIDLVRIITYSAICSIGMFFVGYRYFKKREPIFVDLVK